MKLGLPVLVVVSRLLLALIGTAIITINSNKYALASSESNKSKFQSSTREVVRRRKLQVETEKPKDSKECMYECSQGKIFLYYAFYSD